MQFIKQPVSARTERVNETIVMQAAFKCRMRKKKHTQLFLYRTWDQLKLNAHQAKPQRVADIFS
jgi:hypothetical protein